MPSCSADFDGRHRRPSGAEITRPSLSSDQLGRSTRRPSLDEIMAESAFTYQFEGNYRLIDATAKRWGRSPFRFFETTEFTAHLSNDRSLRDLHFGRVAFQGGHAPW